MYTMEGYGFCTDKFRPTRKQIEEAADASERVRRIVDPFLQDCLRDRLTDKEISEAFCTEYEGADLNLGISALMADVLSARCGLIAQNICSVTDSNGHGYVLYVPTYPWYLSTEDLKLTPETLDDLFTQKLAELIGDKEICGDYLEISCD